MDAFLRPYTRSIDLTDFKLIVYQPGRSRYRTYWRNP